MTLRLVLVGWAAVLAASCASPDPYVCATNADCTRDGVEGTCVAADDGRSYCSELERLSGDECFPGAALDADDSSCIAEVCAAAPWCCAASWGPTCVMAAETACEAACGGRVAFARERLTNGDHTMLLEDGGVEVWDFGADLSAPAAVSTGISGLFAYWRVAWFDAERDGAPELLATTWDGYINGDHQWVYRPAAGGAAWTEAVDLMTVGASDNVIDSAFGDYDGDGRVDLAMVGGGAVEMMHAVATGDLFAPGAEVPALPDVDPLTASVDAGDVDGDGDDDFVYADYRHNLARVLRSGGGTFTIGPALGTSELVSQTRFGDVDGDRDLDLLICDQAGALVYANDGTGAFTLAWSYPPAPRVDGNWARAIWADIDADGDLDVVLGGGPNPGLLVVENVEGTLGATPLWESPLTLSADLEALEAGDIDGDGDLDLAVAGGDGAASRIWRNDGDRTFSIGWEDATARRHRGVALTRRD